MEQPLKYAVEQRLRMIDFLLHQYGHISCSALVEYFGISRPAATRDFRAYKNLAQDNMVLNQSDKLYCRTQSFKRVRV